jgi:HEAT repeat protein
MALPALETALGHRDSAVRAAAVAALQARGEAGVYALLRAAAHGNRRQRQEAVMSLGTMRDVRALQPLLASLANDRRERRSRSMGRFCRAVIVACFSFEVAAPLCEATMYADAELQICAAEALGNLGDVRALLPLIGLGREPHVEVCKAARNALHQLLPRVAELPPHHVRVLGTNVVPELASLLYDHDVVLVRLTMAALYAVGDGQAIPALSRLATAAERPYLHQEARHLLAVLTEREAHERLRTTLLRGSRIPTMAAGPASQQLLRSAATCQERAQAPFHLLRPVGEDKGCSSG